MLKKINRGLGRKDFEISRKEGKMIQTPLFGVSVIRSEGENGISPVRIGFVVSKKISKRAVDRNKIRRRLTEVIGGQINDEKLIINNYKIIILVRKSTLDARIEEIEKCWRMVYEKLVAKNTDIL